MAKMVRFQRSREAGYPVEVQDEARFRENLAQLWERFGGESQDLTAQLILEKDNLMDSSAVRVEVEDQTVGYLSLADAQLYRAKLVDLGVPEVIGICTAQISLAPREQDGTTVEYAVRLDMDLSNLALADEAVAEEIAAPEPIAEPPKRKYSQNQIIAVIAGVVFSCGCLGCAGLYLLSLVLRN